MIGRERFAFGRNWRSFLPLIDEERIAEAQASFEEMLSGYSLRGRRVLDVGSGSGLSSLAARRLGARVHSFDCDLEAVTVTRALKDRFFPGDEGWAIEQGSVLDASFMADLGTFDLVYAWGVLHHTGAMWQALANALGALAPGGRAWIALYNDQGGASLRWRAVKRTYNRVPPPVKAGIVLAVGSYFLARGAARRLTRFESLSRALEPAARRPSRGMSRWHDLIDWVGGYPFEVARPDEVLAFGRRHGLHLERLRICGGGLGNNEYLFARDGSRLR